MQKVIDWLKSQRLGKVITVFLSGLLLFVSTACGGGNVLAKTADQIREEVPQGAVTSPYQGGMNDYSDVDPRKDTKGAQAKAKALVDNAERNVIDENSDVGVNTQVGENLKKVGEALTGSGADVKEKAQKSAEDFAKGTQRGIENIKGNSQDALGGVKESADDAGDAVKSKVSSDIKTTKETLGKAADTGKEVTNKAKGSVEDAGNAVRGKVHSDIKTTQKALDKADDAIDD